MIDDEAVSQFVFHPAHNHRHITAVALFEVRKPLDDGRGVHGQALRGTDPESLNAAFL